MTIQGMGYSKTQEQIKSVKELQASLEDILDNDVHKRCHYLAYSALHDGIGTLVNLAIDALRAEIERQSVGEMETTTQKGGLGVMLKCCICGDVFDVGYEMPNGDYICATHECCYEYCKCEGERITQENED